MNVAYLFDPVKQFVSRNGIPLAGGFLNVFVGESQEPADTFSDAAGTVMNPKRIPIDSAGRAPGVFVDDSKLYTLKAYNYGGELQFSVYPVAPGKGGGGGGNSYYYPGDEYIYIDQDAREISLHNTKAIRGDEETITMEDTQDAIILHVNPDIIGEEAHVAAGEHTSVDYDSDSNTYTVNAEYAGSDTVGIDSDGVITGKYKGGYGIEISGNTIKKTHHKLMATNSVTYNYCKVFDFTWQHVYGRGLCVFTATHYGGDYVTFAVSLTRALGADFTIAWPYVVSASPYMAQNGFVERLEIREVGDRIIGYLKLRSFSQSQFWLDWEGASNCGIVSFTPELTNSPEGDIVWNRKVEKYDVFYSQYDTDRTFQKKLTAGENISIDSDNVISAVIPEDDYTAGWGILIDSDKEIAIDPTILPDASNVFIATYGQTSYEDIRGAIDAGKAVIVKDGIIQYTVVSNSTDLWSAPCVFFGAMRDEYTASFPKRALISVRNVTGQGTVWYRHYDDRLALYNELPLVAIYGSTAYNTINSAINNGRIVVLKTTNSAENIDWAFYGGHDVYPDTNEHYFFGLGTGGQRYIYTVNSSNNWTQTAIDENAGKVFFATYNSTSFSDIKNAITQGKYVVAKSGSIYYTMSHNFDARIVFMGKTSLTANVDNFIEVDSDNVWTSTNVALAVTSFTAHGSVTTTDEYNDVGHTTSFAIGQKGTHGGVLDIGAKVADGGWTGDYKVFTRLYHNSTSSSAPASGSTDFGTVTLSSNYINIGTVSQYLLMTGVQWTYIIELAYSAAPGRSLRLTISGIGSTNITYFAEEIR